MKPGDLSRFAYHTGAPLRRLPPNESCPVLFRDLGPVGTALYLDGALKRMAGPYMPIVYMRTAEYREPYVDYEPIGRLALLRPFEPWWSGVERVYVGRVDQMVYRPGVAWVPPGVDLTDLAGQRPVTLDELRELVDAYDERAAATRQRLDVLAAELARVELRAAPLRTRLKSSVASERSRAREDLERRELTEQDLCTAWHHLPLARREWIEVALERP